MKPAPWSLPAGSVNPGGKALRDEGGRVRPFPTMGGHGRLVRAFAAAVLVGTAMAGGYEATGGEPSGPTADHFRPCVKAWEARDAAGVAQCVREKEGRVDLDLTGARDKPVKGRYTRESAERALSRYFETIEKARLEDKTPASTPNATTRTYDYSYRPKDGEERTTRLSITLEAHSDGHFCLVAVSERPKPK